MTISIKNLDQMFKPKSIAVIGASNKEGTIGHSLMRSLIGEGYDGVVYPVSETEDSIQGVHAFDNIYHVPKTVDLSLITVPMDKVVEVLNDSASTGVGGAIIYTTDILPGSRFKVDKSKLEKAVLDMVQEYGIRVLGPNSLGFISPHANVNTAMCRAVPMKGSVAFISQSNSIFPAILDWTSYKGVGFSSLVSVGSMVDITIADLIDYFGMDRQTRSIMLYIEALCDFKDFMSAARHYAKSKPIIAVKSGRFSQTTLAAESHTGILTTTDALYDAAFKRAGILRVDGLQELFNCSSALAFQTRPPGNRFVIITNAGGPGIMCADQIIERGGELVDLTEATIERLSSVIRGHWSRSNPVTLKRNARPEEYGEVLRVLQRAKDVDGIVVILTPTNPDQSEKVALSVVDALSLTCLTPVLAAWMGRDSVRSGRVILEKGGIPTFDQPEKAADTLLYMYQYGRNLEDLYETPEDILKGFEPDRKKVRDILKKVSDEGRRSLTEYEALLVLQAYDIPTVRSRMVKNLRDCLDAAKDIGYPLVLKLVSPQIPHKSEVGGVILNIGTEEGVTIAFKQIMRSATDHHPDIDINGILVQPMVTGQGYEVIVGLKWDPCFGPGILFGAGGVMVELIKDRSIGFPPLNQALARRMISDTQMDEVLSGFRDRPPAEKRLLEEAIVKISYLSIDFPEIFEMDINPLYIDDKGLMALDATLVIDPEMAKEVDQPGKHLIIGLYPTKYNIKWGSRDGTKVDIRVIRPEDEPRWKDLLESLSKDAIRNRFFAPIRDIDKDMAVMYCHIDYDREIAMTMNTHENGQEKMIGVGRLIKDPHQTAAEFAVVVADRYQGKGLGGKLLDILIEIGKDRGYETIWGDILKDNEPMLRLCAARGFRPYISDEEDAETVHVVLDL